MPAENAVAVAWAERVSQNDTKTQEINASVQRDLFSETQPSIPRLAKIVNINAPGSLSRGWPRFWDRLTFTDRSFVETLSEGIDNPAAEMSHFGPINVDVTIGGDWVKGTLDLETAWIRIRDNGPGIELSRLEQCLSLGELARETADSLHEHGVGMKTMLLMFCRSVESLRHIATKSKNEAHGYRFSYYDHENPERPFGEIPVRFDSEIFAPHEHGTEFYIVGLSDKSVYRRRQDYTTYVIEQLGFKYARLLAGETFHGHKLSLRFRLCNRDGSPLIGKDGKVECDWEIKPVVQRYRDAARPTIDQEKLEGPGPDGKSYCATLSFGRAAQEEEYDAAGLDTPGSKHPCYQYHRQFHVVMHGKVITSLDIGVFGGNPKSCTYVPYTGVITLINGFSTTYEKNGIVNDSNWQELRERVFVKVKKLIGDWSEESPGHNEEKEKRRREAAIRDKYAARLRVSSPGGGKRLAHTEYSVEGSGGRMDIFYFENESDAEGIVIEIKPDTADGNDVWQTYGYLFMSSVANKKVCRLVAEDFSTGARETARRIKNEYGVEVELYTLKELDLDRIDD